MSAERPQGDGESRPRPALAEVPEAERPLVQLVLLTAFAPYRIANSHIAAFRALHPTDRELVEITSWRRSPPPSAPAAGSRTPPRPRGAEA